MDEKELKTKGKGSLDFKAKHDKAVNLFSSFVGVKPLGNVRHWDCKSKTYVMVPRSAIVDTYNRFMGGGDFLDMLSALYLHCTVQLQIPKMVHLQLVAHCYSFGNQCMLQKRLVETAAQAETPAPVNECFRLLKFGFGNPTWEARQRCKYCTGHFTQVYCQKLKLIYGK